MLGSSFADARTRLDIEPQASGSRGLGFGFRVLSFGFRVFESSVWLFGVRSIGKALQRRILVCRLLLVRIATLKPAILQALSAMRPESQESLALIKVGDVTGDPKRAHTSDPLRTLQGS